MVSSSEYWRPGLGSKVVIMETAARTSSRGTERLLAMSSYFLFSSLSMRSDGLLVRGLAARFGFEGGDNGNCCKDFLQGHGKTLSNELIFLVLELVHEI